jgi:NAD(P)-dependent dehydrogenase (short-subunit alcohol dehydrogenase family)
MDVSPEMLKTFPSPSSAVVIGAGGGIGGALVRRIEGSRHFQRVTGFLRDGAFRLDLRDEPTIAEAARSLADGPPVRLVIVATGALNIGAGGPEKTWRNLEPASMAEAFAINAIGPALVAKHFLPLLPREGKAVFAALSARVGSIGDNRLGGWYSYRASKAALNQIIRTASIELARQRPEAVCLAIHPGTVDSNLSRPHGKSGLDVRAPDVAAAEILAVLDGVTAQQTGAFLDHKGMPVPW